MPLEYVDLQTNKTNTRLHLEEENKLLKEQLSEMDAIVLEILLTIGASKEETV